MKSGDFTHCKTLPEFNRQIVTMLQEAHGEDYIDNHKELRQLAEYISGEYDEYCTIKELGVNQGASLSSIMLIPEVDEVIGVEIKPEYFEPYKKLFEEWADIYEIDFCFLGTSSLYKTAINLECDILHIDSLHEYGHLRQELWAHGPNTNYFILIHDTTLFPKQKKAIKEFLNEFKDWELMKEEKRNVGYVVLQRKIND